MLAHADTVALIVLVVLVATLLPMYAKWRAMQALVDRLARRGMAQAQSRDRSGPSNNDLHEPVKDSSDARSEPTTPPWTSS